MLQYHHSALLHVPISPSDPSVLVCSEYECFPHFCISTVASYYWMLSYFIMGLACFFLLYPGGKKCTCHCAIWWCKRFDKRAIQTNVCRRLAICAEILPTHFCAINCAGRLKLHTHANLQVLLLDANFAKSEIFLVFLGHQNYNSRHLKWYYKGVRQVFFILRANNLLWRGYIGHDQARYSLSSVIQTFIWEALARLFVSCASSSDEGTSLES